MRLLKPGRIVVSAGCPLLGATNGEPSTWVDFGLWSAILLAAILVLAAVVYFFRGRVQANRKNDETSGPAFTLQQLRELRDRGELSQAEFDHLRATMLDDARRS
jgi:hypothetical protein